MSDFLMCCWLGVFALGYLVGGLFACSWAINMVCFGVNAATHEHYQPAAIVLLPVVTLVLLSICSGIWRAVIA